MERQFILIGVLLALLHVLLSAFATHWLQPGWSADQIRWFNTAGDYHITHALALIVCALTSLILGASRWFSRACLLLLVGLLIFCGSLYAMTLTEITRLGIVTPVGGLGMILGWMCYAIAVMRGNNR